MLRPGHSLRGLPHYASLRCSAVQRLKSKLMVMNEGGRETLLIIEPFYGGSHKKLIDIVSTKLPKNSYTLITMTAKKWHWRARTSALYISVKVPKQHNYKVLFCTSVLPLAELLGLRPDLMKLKKIVYFHENQLNFPVQVIKQRDFQYGFNEILTCLAADTVLFNSSYNQESFLSKINSHLKLQPDYKIKNICSIIQPKCKVIYYPLNLNEIEVHLSTTTKQGCEELYIVWPHRWEFDKNPDTFFRTICKLYDAGYKFKISILGESFSDKPEVFNELLNKFKSKLIHCGFVEDIADYYRILQNADVVVSTAIHEFFGVAVLEAVYCGCLPIVPNRLSYVEIFGNKIEGMYETEEQLYDILSNLCIQKQSGNIFKNYKHLALPYDSNTWYTNFCDEMQQKIDAEL